MSRLNFIFKYWIILPNLALILRLLSFCSLLSMPISLSRKDSHGVDNIAESSNHFLGRAFGWVWDFALFQISTEWPCTVRVAFERIDDVRETEECLGP